MRILTYSFFGSALLLLVALFFHNIIEFDQDLGRHLLMGGIIWENRSVPLTNLLSYTHPNYPFINSHWLSEVIFFLVGVPALLYLKVIVLCSSFMLVLYTSYKYSKTLASTAVAFLVFVPVVLERTEIRPEIFSYLFIACFMAILTLQKRKLFWLLPILQLVWVNSHIYFILGPALVLIFAASYKDKFLAKIFALCLSACLINPNFLNGAIYPLSVFNNYGYSIVENQNIFFLAQVTNNINITYFGIAALAFIGSWFLSKKITVVNVLLSGLIVLPIMHIRSFPLLFLILLPVFSFNLANLRFRVPAIKPEYIVILVVALIIIRFGRLATNDYYMSIDSRKRFGNEIQESGKGAVDFVLENGLKGPIFNNFDNGSYLDYRLYPKDKVFIDGRPEAYPVSFFQQVYIPMQMSSENFDRVDEIYKFNTIIFAHTDGTPWAGQFLTEIAKNPKWHLVYIDPHTAVLTKKRGKTKIVAPKTDMENLTMANFFFAIGQKDRALSYLQEAYSLNPNSAIALNALGQTYLQNNTTYHLGQKYIEAGKKLRLF